MRRGVRRAAGGGLVAAALSVLAAGCPSEAHASAIGGAGSAPEPPTARAAQEPAPRRTLVAVIHVRFRFGRADLDAAGEAALTAIVNELRDDPTLTVDLEGATDPVGPLDYNMRLSQRRVETVERWLLANGVSRDRLIGAAGRGPLLDSAVEDDAKRRVAVKLMALQ